MGDSAPNTQMSSLLDISKVASLGKSLRDSGVNAMFLADGNHESDSAKLQMAGTVAGFKPDLVFMEIGAERRDAIYNDSSKIGNNHAFMKAAADGSGSKMVAIDPWSENKKQEYYKHSDAAGEAIERNQSLQKQREEVAKTGDAKQLNKIDSQLQTSAKEFRSNHEISSRMLAERQGDGVNDGMAQNMANEIEKFYKQNGRMPTFAAELGKSHIEGRNDVDEKLMKKLEEKGLPTEQYKNHKDITFDDKGEQGKGASVEKKWLGEFEYKVHAEKEPVSPQNVPDVRSPEQKSEARTK